MGSRGNYRGSESRFKTDADISSAAGVSERPLQPWLDADADSTPAASLADMSLESTKDGKNWDQFAANRDKFGVVPSYDEHLYTTKINKSHPDFHVREQEAARLAREIEGETHNGNAHVAEERGLAFNDSSLDEEDKYSGVMRKQPASGPSQQQVRDFAASEARRAMASPEYLASRERADRQEDFRKFSQNFKIRGEVPADLLPILGKIPKEPASDKRNSAATAKPEAKSEAKPEASLDTKSEPHQQSKPESKPAPKRKFDFAAAAAKASSFKSPSPHQSFTPMVQSPANSMSPVPPAGMPPMMNVPIPPFSPYGAPPSGLPGMGPPGVMPFAMTPNGPRPDDADASKSSGPDVSQIKPLDGAFDFVAALQRKGDAAPKMYDTPPKWPTTSTVSYVDQFPAVVMMPRMASYMPPVGFMMPPQF